MFPKQGLQLWVGDGKEGVLSKPCMFPKQGLQLEVGDEGEGVLRGEGMFPPFLAFPVQ